MIPVAARSKAWVCGRSFVGTASWKPAGGVDTCERCLLCSYKSLRRADPSSRGALPSLCVCVCVCVVCVYVCVCVSVSVIGYNINLLQLQRLRRDRSRIKNYFLLNYLISRRLNSKCPTSSLPTRTGHLLLFSIFFLTLLNFHTPPNNHAICFLFHTLMWYITYN